MYNGIGLQTARGSGTNGYVQTNKFFVRPKAGRVADNSRGFENDQGTAGVTKKANKDILEHDRKRQIELKLVVLEDKLVDQGYTVAEIAEKLEEARSKLLAAAASEASGGAVVSNEKVSDTQTHQVAARKEKQMETLRAALGITASGPEDALVLEPGEIKDDQPKKIRKHGWNEGTKEPEKGNVSDDDADELKAKEIIKGKKIEVKHKRKKYESSSSDYGSEKELDSKGKSKSKNHQQSKRRYDSSETDSDGKNVKRSSNKTKRSRNDTDSDSDSDRAKKRKTKQRRRRYDSSGSESSEKQENLRKKYKKHISKRSESEPGSDESDSYDDSSDTDSGKDKRRHVPKRPSHKQKNLKDDYSSESDSDERFANAKTMPAGQQKRHNNDEDDSDSADGGDVKRGMEAKKLSSKYTDDATDGGDGSRKSYKVEEENRWENKRSEDERSFRSKHTAGSDPYKQRDGGYKQYENRGERDRTRHQEESRGINYRYKGTNDQRSDRYRVDEINEERYDPQSESKTSMRGKGDTDDLHAERSRSDRNRYEEPRDRRHGGRYYDDSDKNDKDRDVVKDKARYGDYEKGKNRNYGLSEESKDVKKTKRDDDYELARLGKEEDQHGKRKMHAREEENEKRSRRHERRADESPKRARYSDDSPSDERRKDVGRHVRSRR